MGGDPDLMKIILYLPWGWWPSRARTYIDRNGLLAIRVSALEMGTQNRVDLGPNGWMEIIAPFSIIIRKRLRESVVGYIVDLLYAFYSRCYWLAVKQTKPPIITPVFICSSHLLRCRHRDWFVHARVWRNVVRKECSFGKAHKHSSLQSRILQSRIVKECWA